MKYFKHMILNENYVNEIIKHKNDKICGHNYFFLESLVLFGSILDFFNHKNRYLHQEINKLNRYLCYHYCHKRNHICHHNNCKLVFGLLSRTVPACKNESIWLLGPLLKEYKLN